MTGNRRVKASWRKLLIEADPETVWDLLYDADSWPNLIPHVRSVCTESAHRMGRIVRLGVVRYQIPVTARCLLVSIQSGTCLRIFHIGGITRGLVETWWIRDHGDDEITVAVAVNDWAPGWRPVRRLARRWLAEPLAIQMLDMVTLLAESDYLAHQGIGPDGRVESHERTSQLPPDGVG